MTGWRLEFTITLNQMLIKNNSCLKKRWNFGRNLVCIDCLGKNPNYCWIKTKMCVFMTHSAPEALLMCRRLKQQTQLQILNSLKVAKPSFPTSIRNHFYSHWYSGTKAKQFINTFHLTQPGPVQPWLCSRPRFSRSDASPKSPHLNRGWMGQLPSTLSQTCFIQVGGNHFWEEAATFARFFFSTFPLYKNRRVTDSTGGLDSLPRPSVRSVQGFTFVPLVVCVCVSLWGPFWVSDKESEDVFGKWGHFSWCSRIQVVVWWVETLLKGWN